MRRLYIMYLLNKAPEKGQDLNEEVDRYIHTIIV